MLLHVPTLPVTLHDVQVAVHKALQQTPSAHWPVKHSDPMAHGAPLTFLQTPLASHWFIPVQTFVGKLSVWPAGVLLHVPTDPATLHDRHAVVQELLQQTPSAQKPLRHVALFEQT
jgi:hypothetical protein